MVPSNIISSHFDACQRVAWFVFEALQREHLITLKAWSATARAMGLGWPLTTHAFAAALPAVHCRACGRPAPDLLGRR